jgi:hypothetical protein
MATTSKKTELLDPNATNSPAQTFGKNSNSNEANQTIEAKSTLNNSQPRKQNQDGKSVASRTTNR